MNNRGHGITQSTKTPPRSIRSAQGGILTSRLRWPLLRLAVVVAPVLLGLLALPVLTPVAYGQATNTLDLSVSHPSISESAGSSTTVTVTVATASASTTFSEPSTVTVNVAGGGSNPATAGTDFTAVSSFTITLPANTHSATGTFTFTPTSDEIVEGDETVLVSATATNPLSTVTFAVNSATITLTDDDQSTISIVGEASAPAGHPVVFTISLTKAVDVALDLTFSTFNETASTPADYVSHSQTPITIAAGETSATISVTTTASDTDTVVEATTKTFLGLVTFPGHPPGYETIIWLDNQASFSTATIHDDDTRSAAPTGLAATFDENAGNIELSWTAPSDTGLLNGAAAAITGYQFRSAATSAGLSSATWTATGGTTAAYTVSSPTPNDLFFQVRALTGVTEPDGNPAAGAASDEAMTTNLPTISVADASADEGDAVSFTVSLSFGWIGDVTVNWATSDGTATAPADYTATTSGTVTIPAGMTAATFTVPTAEDALDEDDKTFTVTLSAPTGGAALDPDPTATGTINDDDDPPVLSVASPSVNEGDSGTTTMPFTLTLSEASGKTVTVAYRISTSSEANAATAGTDFDTVTTDQTVSFAPGETSKTVPATVHGDTFAEGDEVLDLALVKASLMNAEFDSALTGNANFNFVPGTIVDDDIAPTTIALSVSPTSIAEGGAATGVTVTATFPPGSDPLPTATDLAIAVGGTATTTTDYALTVGGDGELTIRIPAGATSGTNTNALTISPVQDTSSEGDETIVFSVATPPPGFTSVTPTALTIVDDDISASISNPPSLTERALNGARLTVNLVATRYVSALSPGHFRLLPDIDRLSITSVTRVSNTQAVLTLGFTGNITANLDLQVAVDGSGHTSSGLLTTGTVRVTQAPRPPRVDGVRLTPGPGSLDVSWGAAANADGYVVRWKRITSAGYDSRDQRVVRGASTTQTTLGELLGETAYDVEVWATSDFARDGLVSWTIRTTTLPGHAFVSATDPSPLTERNLDGATLTIDLLPDVYDPWAPRLDRAEITVSGVPGVTFAGATRVSEERMVVTVAYDDTDFDTDAVLRVRFYLAHTSIETVTAVADVKAVVETPPEQVQNVRATPGTQQVHVKWDAVPSAYENLDANVYKVQWKESASTGGWHERKVRGSQTAMTIGARPGTEYTVRVIATRHKAQDGPPSAEARATTPEFRYRLGGTEPASLTEANLRGAALLVDLEGAKWNLGLPRYRFTVSGVPGVWVERVERVSDSRAKVILSYRGNDFDTDATLRLRVFADTYSWNEEVNLTTTVRAVVEGVMNVRAEAGDGKITVSWDRIDGASAYRLEWKGPGEGYHINRAVVIPGPSFTITRNLQASTENYTVRVREFVRYKGWGQWEETTTPSTAPNMRASVTVAAANPVAVNEGGAGATYTVVLAGQPTGDVTITTTSDNGDVTTQPTSLTFTPDNWDTPQTVRVRASDDDDAADDSATLSHEVSGADGYAGIAVDSVAVAVSDDDTAAVTMSESSISLEEGGSATYTVSLGAQPLCTVEVHVFAQGVSVEPDVLTFTSSNWRTAQTVTVSAAHDDDTSDGTGAITHGVNAIAGSGYENVSAGFLTVSISDDEPTPEAAQEQAEPAQQQQEEGSEEPAAEPESETLTEREVLAAFYEATGGADWTNNANWLSDKPLSQWHGVTTNGQGLVTHLSLRNNNLSGSLPGDIGKLESLQVLSLDRNSISGSLPAELGNLSNLNRLAMNRNSLTGAIPSELGNLSNLSILGLARNSLSGTLPSSLGNLSALTRVSLHDNTALSGSLPSGFGSMAGLTRLAVSRTGLSGPLPQGLINSALAYLHYDDTGLCAPANDDFQTWLDGVADKNGPTCE